MTKPLQDAIECRTKEYVEALDRMLDLASASGGEYDESGVPADVRVDFDRHLLLEAVELTRCLRRLVDGRTQSELHSAFGAPGDFGYETPIGDALSRIYRGEP